MMNPHSRLGYLWMPCIMLSLLYSTNVKGTQADKDIDGLAKAYRAARMESERRAVCLDAIDAGVVARDRPVTVIDAIFGTTYAGKLPPAGGGLETGVVDFHPSPPSPGDARQAAYIGWYLAFKFDSAGKLQDYYLSNVHQK